MEAWVVALLAIGAGFVILVLLPSYRKWKREEERKEDEEMLRQVEQQLPPGYVEFLREEKEKSVPRD